MCNCLLNGCFGGHCKNSVRAIFWAGDSKLAVSLDFYVLTADVSLDSVLNFVLSPLL